MPDVDVVEDVRARLADLDDRPVDGHVDTYDAVQRLLAGALAALDED